MIDFDLSLCMRKPILRVINQVGHRPACTATEEGKNFESLDLRRRGIDYPCSGNKGVDQLCSICTADLRLCFRK